MDGALEVAPPTNTPQNVSKSGVMQQPLQSNNSVISPTFERNGANNHYFAAHNQFSNQIATPQFNQGLLTNNFNIASINDVSLQHFQQRRQ